MRPGIYAVTFTLPGFSTFRRDGLELTSGFTATVNAELRVGMPIEISLRMPREVTGLETVEARCFGRVVHARTGMFADGSTGYGVEIEKFTSPAYAEKWAS